MVEEPNYRNSKMLNLIFEKYFITQKSNMQQTIFIDIDWKLKQITSVEGLVEFSLIKIKNAWEKIELNRSSDESIQSIKDEKWIKAEILIKAHFIDVDDS